MSHKELMRQQRNLLSFQRTWSIVIRKWIQLPVIIAQRIYSLFTRLLTMKWNINEITIYFCIISWALYDAKYRLAEYHNLKNFNVNSNYMSNYIYLKFNISCIISLELLMYGHRRNFVRIEFWLEITLLDVKFGCKFSVI